MSPYPNCHVNRRDPLSPSRRLRSSAEPLSHPDRGISSEAKEGCRRGRWVRGRSRIGLSRHPLAGGLRERPRRDARRIPRVQTQNLPQRLVANHSAAAGQSAIVEPLDLGRDRKHSEHIGCAEAHYQTFQRLSGLPMTPRG